MTTKIPIYIVCWDDDLANANSRPQIVNETLVFTSSSEAGSYSKTLNEDAKNHGWDLTKSGYMVKTLDIELDDTFD